MQGTWVCVCVFYYLDLHTFLWSSFRHFKPTAVTTGSFASLCTPNLQHSILWLQLRLLRNKTKKDGKKKKQCTWRKAIQLIMKVIFGNGPKQLRENMKDKDYRFPFWNVKLWKMYWLYTKYASSLTVNEPKSGTDLSCTFVLAHKGEHT